MKTGEIPQPGKDPVDTGAAGAVRPIMETLSRLRDGRVMDLMSVEMNRVVRAVAENAAGKGGSVTLTVKVERNARIPNGVYIQAVIQGKAPEDPPDTELFFFDDDGNLHTRNPRQRDAFEDGPRGV